MTENRRHFSRIHFQAEAHLVFPDGNLSIELLDLSLKGALVRPKSAIPIELGSHCLLEICLDDGETVIRMEVAVVHQEDMLYGLACREIDLDSVTHLRRLVALNLGDEALLERELAMLVSPLPVSE
jgi:hypothetical protein